MELNEKLDKKYQSDKQAYEKIAKLKEHVNKAKKEIKKYERAKKNAEMNKQWAIEDKDKTAETNADAAIKLAKEEIEKLQKNVEKMNSILANSKAKVDSYIEELSKDPEFKAHMNSILEKRYNRKREKAIYIKEQTNLLIDLCEKHPSLENNLKGMIRAKEELDKLDEELNKLDPVKDKSRIDEINNTEIPTLVSKRGKNEKIFMEFCTKNNINIDKDLIKNLIMSKKEKEQMPEKEKNKDKYKYELEFSFAHDKNGEIKLAKSLKNISKGYDKRINAYERAIQKIPGAKVYEENIEGNRARQNSNDLNNDGLDEQDQHPAKKFKWWEFRKRFKDWRERRNVKKQGKQAEKEGTAPRESSEKFRNAYKYDVVKDYIDKKEEVIFKEAGKEIKQANKNGEER